MKNSIKLLLLSLFVPLFIGVSFGASSIPNFNNDYLVGSYSFSYDAINNPQYQYLTYNGSFEENNSVLCFVFNGTSSSPNPYVSLGIVLYYNSFNSTSVSASQRNVSLKSSSFPFYTCQTSYSVPNDGNILRISNGGLSELFGTDPLKVDFYLFPPSSFGGSDCSVVENKVYECNSNLSTLSGQYNTCLDRVNTLNGQIGTLSGSLQSCNSDLASCTNSCDTLVSQCVDEKNNLQTNLSGCFDDKNSLQNYNNSLSDQLNECLSNGTGGTGLTFVPQFDLFRSSDGTDYSFPISNNLFLPYGYKGFINEGVLSIKQDNSLNTAYSISDDDYENKIIGSYSTIFLFLISSGLFLVFLFVIRKYFIGLHSFK